MSAPRLSRSSIFSRLARLGGLLSILCAPVAAQGELWTVQPGTAQKDRARAVAFDGVGAVIVAGTTLGDLGGVSAGHLDIWLARFDLSGTLMWKRQFGSDTLDEVVAATSDGAGGVYVCGTTLGNMAGANLGGSDIWLARIEVTGSLMWVRQFGTSAHDEVRGMAADNAGGVFLTGASLGAYGGPRAGGWDAWVERVDPLGNRLWVRQVGSSQDDWAMGAASAGSGGVFLVGYTRGDLAGPAGGGFDAWRARFDRSGNEVWRHQSQSPRPDSATAVVADGAGGFFAVGSANWSGGGSTWHMDGWLARYDAQGAVTWNRPLQQSYVDVNQAVASDGAGGVFLYASVVEPAILPLPVTVDIAISRFDGLGAQLWSRRIGSGLDPFNEWGDLVGDGAGGLFACGATFEDLAATNAGESDAWLVRLHGSQP